MKRFFKPFAIGASIGVALVSIKYFFDIEPHVFTVSVWTLAAGIVVAALLYDLCYTLPLRRRMLQAMKLMQAGRCEEAVEQIEVQLRQAEHKGLRSTQLVCRLNLAAAYIDLKRYEEAIAMLEALPEERLHGQMKLVYAINLCLCCFLLGQSERALALYAEHETLFSSYQRHRMYGGSIAILRIFSALSRCDLPAARQELASARTRWESPQLDPVLEVVERTLCKLETQERDSE